MEATWKDIAARKQKERDSHAELKITEDYSATSLLEEIRSRRLQSLDVVRAFCKRAAIAQQLVNCCTEILFEDAFARAKELDRRLVTTGEPVGPLHGLPISVKDCFKIKGYDSSVGVANLCFKPAEANSALIDQLLSLGAVLYVKTNVPATMMALDSHNNVFGRTLNPANRLLTAGGSSGGEGALIAMRGSVLGIGTDVGGSIRIPAACNGLWGIKPSHGRMPYSGQESGQKPGSSKLAIEATAGPIATSLQDCELLLRVVADSAPQDYDVEVIPQDWLGQVPLNTKGHKLRVGLIGTDAIAQPLPIISRLMIDVAKTLHASEHDIEVVWVDASPILSKILKVFNGLVSIDGANAWFDHLEQTGEPLSPWLQGRLTRRPQKSTDAVRALQAQKSELQAEFSRVWREDGGYWHVEGLNDSKGDRVLDVLIMPVAPHPILPIDKWNTVNYTGSLNLLDLPAGVIPVRNVVHEDLIGVVPSSPPLNAWDRTNREHWTKVDRRVYLDSPLSVQVMTPRLTERKLVEAMAILDRALQPLRGGKFESLTSKL